MKAIPSLLRWLLTGCGPLTSIVAEILAFIQAHDLHQSVLDYRSGAQLSSSADIEIIGAPLRYADQDADKVLPGEGVYSMVPIGLRPQSAGRFTLKSTDVFDAPLIDPRYWTDKGDNDRKVLLVGLRVCLKLMRSPALQAYLEPVEANDDIGSHWWPCSSLNVEAITDDQLKQWMGRAAFALYQPVGSNRMSPSASGTNAGVVDLECRVHGMVGLCVVDASNFPAQISGHPTAAIVAMAGKVIDMIKGVSPPSAGNSRARL